MAERQPEHLAGFTAEEAAAIEVAAAIAAHLRWKLKAGELCAPEPASVFGALEHFWLERAMWRPTG